MTDAAELVTTLEALATVAEREKYTRFFPPDPDAPFIGVRMGAVFDLAKTALDLPIPELESLLERPTHEVRARWYGRHANETFLPERQASRSSSRAVSGCA